MKENTMITDADGMREMEKASGLTVMRLMENAGKALAASMQSSMREKQKICILAGHGNNGGDGFVIARILQTEYKISVLLVDGMPQTKEALRNYKKLDASLFVEKNHWKRKLEQADVIVDAVYGFGYHGALNPEMASLFDFVNGLNHTVYAVDLNSGCEADTGHCDPHALHSTITYALDCYKPFHLLRKEHQMFEECICLDLQLPYLPSKYLSMDEEKFFAHFPKKKENAYKGTYGKTLLIGGCFGMAGAVSLNIIGAKTVGAPYINCALPEEIYDIVSTQHITTVFHPFGHQTVLQVLEPLVEDTRVCAFGSGCACMDRKNDVLDYVLQNCHAPIILDAAAIRLLKHNTWVLRFTNAPVILTPHLGEFADLINQPTAYIKDHKIECAMKFAQENKVIVVLKGPNTIAAFPNGEVYINETGNQALAQAGAGDLLTGILAGTLTFTTDVTSAVCMGIWLHGHLADLGIQKHSRQNFPLEQYPEIMDQLFMKHGY
jgi:yjeF C-terminal region, hydroxyethylthiazole kinase-related/yjeF N-terminal region